MFLAYKSVSRLRIIGMISSPPLLHAESYSMAGDSAFFKIDEERLTATKRKNDMIRIALHLLLVSILGLLGATPSLADSCSDAREIVDVAITKPPAANSEAMFVEGLNKCPKNPNLYEMIGDYYVHWSKSDIKPENQAIYNYLATEYYAKGIKIGKGDAVKPLRYKLAALESDTEEITAVGIRSIKPGARLNIKVMFEFGSSELTAGAQKQLDLLGQYLTEGDASRVVLEGHTDMAGTEPYNRSLSVQRAENAKQYLISRFNLSPDMIETHGYGFDRLADVDDPFNAKNRRVRVRKLPQ